MNVGSPYLAVFPRVWGATLLALHRTVAPMTGREVARRAGVSQPAALAALGHFVEHGLVRSQPAGRAYLYSLNDEHLASAGVAKIFGIRAALVERLKQALSHWELPPAHLSLFGSVARADGDATSDVDLLVVRPRLAGDNEAVVWRGQLDTLVHDIELWTGNRAALVELSHDELASMRRDNHRLIREARRDGILVGGESLDKVRPAKPRRSREPAVAR